MVNHESIINCCNNSWFIINCISCKQCWIKIEKIDGTIDNIDASDDGIIDPYIKVYGYNSGGSSYWKCDTDYDYNDVTPDWFCGNE